MEFRVPGTGVLVDPTTVTFNIKRPDTGALTTYTYPPVGVIIRDSTGHYRANHTCNFPGEWPHQWTGAGAYIGANEKYVCIMETNFL